MNIFDRICAFARLGTAMGTLPEGEKFALFQRAANQNSWFTNASLNQAWSGVAYMLNELKLRGLMEHYPAVLAPKNVGVTMAGNIPLVGFHDFMCVLLSGHRIWLKPSSNDSVLILFLIEMLKKIEPAFADRIRVVDRLNGIDAAIATGSNNTARYFEYYFRAIPHVIRKNRTSCAVLTGDEAQQDHLALGHDVFDYYGLGCRNVSTLFVPAGYDFTPLLDNWQPFADVAQHHKYANNLDYQKAILLVNQTPFLDGGHVLLQQSPQLASPIAVVHYQTYKSPQALKSKLAEQEELIQIVLSKDATFAGSKPFGFAQRPEPDDFADGLDTLAFLSKI